MKGYVYWYMMGVLGGQVSWVCMAQIYPLSSLDLNVRAHLMLLIQYLEFEINEVYIYLGWLCRALLDMRLSFELEAKPNQPKDPLCILNSMGFFH